MRTDSRIKARTAVRAVFIVFPTVLPLPIEDRRALRRVLPERRGSHVVRCRGAVLQI